MALKTKFGSVQSFFNQYKTFSIPYYQRKYVWSEASNRYVLKKFITDIIDEFDADRKSEYFIGNFAVYTRADTSIIDGQQRLSTIIIFLAELSRQTGVKVPELMPNGKFIIGNKCQLADELSYFLFDKQSDKIPDANCNIAEAKRIISDRIMALLRSHDIQYLKDLQNYVLDNLMLSSIQFQNEKDGMKYFLNINSLSVQLTETEVFMAFTSQVIDFVNSSRNIDSLKSSLKHTDDAIKQLSVENMIDIFLKAYFKDNDHIGSLYDKSSKTGIGRWLTGYKMDLLSDANQANAYLDALFQYANDIDYVARFITKNNSTTTNYRYIWLVSIFNSYTKCRYLVDILSALFKNRHDYRTNNIYKKGSINIDEQKLDSYCKAAFAVIVVNYFNGTPDFLKISKEKSAMTKLSECTASGKSASNIIKNVGYNNMWELRYPRDQQDPTFRLSNDFESIFFILSIQEAYLNATANPSYGMIEILDELLNPNQTYEIEHLITKKDYTDSKRLALWSEKGTFTTSAEFDDHRSRFENLTLLDKSTNSEANSSTLAKKFASYKKANTIMKTNEPEYLAQSLVSDSQFYKNNNLSNLGDRKITIDQNMVTWDLSENNREFIDNVTRKAIQELFN